MRRFCSKACRAEQTSADHLESRGRPRLATATTGAVSELLAAVDLTRRGFSVFRAVSPACSCDLIALMGGRVLRVEVRTASEKLKSGRLSFSRARKDAGRSDVYAIVWGSDVHYEPSLSVWLNAGATQAVGIGSEGMPETAHATEAARPRETVAAWNKEGA